MKFSSLEPLESRIAPAAVISPNGKSATYTDVDGDLVTVKITKGTLMEGNFLFETAGVGERLLLLDLTNLLPDQPSFAGTNLTITARPGLLGGDGFAAVRKINAAGSDLGVVRVDGDLALIAAGDDVGQTPAIKTLAVQSMGRGVDAASETNATFTSEIKGRVGTLTVRTDMIDARLEVTGSGNVDGHVGVATIGGMILSNGAVSGGIEASGTIGKITVRGDLREGTVAADRFGAVTVLGSLLGGDLPGSGSIRADDGMGVVKVGGSLVGGGGNASGAINSGGPVRSITVGGDLLGGSAPSSGSITTALDISNGVGDLPATIGPITIKGSVIAGTNADTGILGGANLGAIKIGRDVRGTEDFSAKIMAEGLASLTNVRQALAIRSLTVGGNVEFADVLAGFSAEDADLVASNADVQIGPVVVTGNWVASSLVAGASANGDGFGNANDTIFGNGENANIAARIASITIKGALYGTAATGDHYGFVAQAIGRIQIGKGRPAVATGTVLAPVTDDVRVLLVGTPAPPQP